MTGLRPLLFLDVDGVLNPYGYADVPPGFVVVRTADDDEPVVLNRQHGEWVRELARVAEVVWATAWNDGANVVIAPTLGIGRLDVVTMPLPPFPPAAKVDRIDAFAAGRPLAWIDDQHGKLARSWAIQRQAPTLLVPVEPSVGLTRSAVDHVVDWAVRL